MIYIVTHNTYLQLAVETLLYPLQTQIIRPCPDNLETIAACNEWDVLVMDIAIPASLIASWRGSISEPRVVFLSSTHEENIVFQSPGIFFHILNCSSPKQQFRQALMDAVAGKLPRYALSNRTFTDREETVFWASLKGQSIPEIASGFYISTHTAYNHRLRACRKLGIRKVAEAIPMLGYFRAYQKSLAAGESQEKEKRLYGTSPGIDLRSQYLR